VDLCVCGMLCAAWSLEQQDEQRLRELEIIEREVGIAKQRMKLQLLTKKLDAIATSQVALIAWISH